SERETPQLRIDNPLALGSALKVAAFIAAVMLAAQLLQWWFGSLGVLIVAAISGIADVDAVTISMARLTADTASVETASRAILIAVAVNTAAKAAMAGWVGGWRIGMGVGGVSAA